MRYDLKKKKTPKNWGWVKRRAEGETAGNTAGRQLLLRLKDRFWHPYPIIPLPVSTTEERRRLP